MTDKKMIIDIRLNSYSGSPTRLIALLDTDTGSLYISGQKSFVPPKPTNPIALLKQIQNKKRTIIVVDSKDTCSDWNMLFNEDEHLLQTIRSYHEKERGQLLKINESVSGIFNPDNVLQKDRVDAKTGSIWSLSEEAENGHMCILVACWAAMKACSTYMFATQVNDEKDYSKEVDSNIMDEPFSI